MLVSRPPSSVPIRPFLLAFGSPGNNKESTLMLFFKSSGPVYKGIKNSPAEIKAGLLYKVLFSYYIHSL